MKEPGNHSVPHGYGHGTHRAHQTMGPGHEFDTIRMLMARWGPLAVDIGDDAAVLPTAVDRVQVVSTDACVEGVHFHRSWISSYDIGVRAAAAAFSDLAAMGARADATLIAMVIPDVWREALADIADGMGHVVGRVGAKIVGGNLSSGDAFSITTTVFGSAKHLVSRNGAQVGDVVVVTGTLGGPGNALNAWKTGSEPTEWARNRFARPMPRLAEGEALAAAGASAMLDISDGLAADARHLAAASSVAVALDATALPVGAGLATEAALVSGEEYELLATIAPSALAALHASWPDVSARPLTVIGSVIERQHGGVLRMIGVRPSQEISTGSPSRVEFSEGHDHFNR